MEKNLYIKNKKAYFDYYFILEFNAGIQLLGTEVKQIRAGKVSLVDAFCFFENNELYIKGLNITKTSNDYSHEPLRLRKLLLNRKELNKIQKELDAGISIIPSCIYTNEYNLIKLKIAVAKGKKLYDKRETIKNRDIDRELRSIK